MIDKKKLLSYTLSSVVAVVLAGGCITPAYYSHQQDISLKIPEGATAEMDGKPLEKRGDTVHTTVNRSWRDKEIVVKKEGYKDATVKLKSVTTKDKWAGDLGSREGYVSAAVLFAPIHTAFAAAFATGATISAPVVAIEEGPTFAATAFLGGLSLLPIGMAIDAFNIFIGAPSTAIVNPWREYEYKGILRKMEPLKQNNLQDANFQKK